MNNITLLLAQTQVSNPFPTVAANSDTLNTVLNIIFAVIGSVAFLIIVIGGFRYVISRGDPQATAQAKDTILYAVIGLVIVISASAIVNFVFGGI